MTHLSSSKTSKTSLAGGLVAAALSLATIVPRLVVLGGIVDAIAFNELWGRAAPAE